MTHPTHPLPPVEGSGVGPFDVVGGVEDGPDVPGAVVDEVVPVGGEEEASVEVVEVVGGDVVVEDGGGVHVGSVVVEVVGAVVVVVVVPLVGEVVVLVVGSVVGEVVVLDVLVVVVGGEVVVVVDVGAGLQDHFFPASHVR